MWRYQIAVEEGDLGGNDVETGERAYFLWGTCKFTYPTSHLSIELRSIGSVKRAVNAVIVFAGYSVCEPLLNRVT